jgi:hypothetical protein
MLRRHDHQGDARRGARLPGAVHDRSVRRRSLHAAAAIAGRIGARGYYRRASRCPALDALGGLGSPAGSCVWHVVGLQRSVREWAVRQGWGGRLLRIEQAQGILIAALGMLAGHYGYGKG